MIIGGLYPSDRNGIGAYEAIMGYFKVIERCLLKCISNLIPLTRTRHCSCIEIGRVSRLTSDGECDSKVSLFLMQEADIYGSDCVTLRDYESS